MGVSNKYNYINEKKYVKIRDHVKFIVTPSLYQLYLDTTSISIK